MSVPTSVNTVKKSSATTINDIDIVRSAIQINCHSIGLTTMGSQLNGITRTVQKELWLKVHVHFYNITVLCVTTNGTTIRKLHVI